MFALAACTRSAAPSSPADAGATIAIASSSPAPTFSSASPDAAPPVTSEDAGEIDFEDQFEYGEFDAGVGDATALTKKPGFDSYTNTRFGFALDVPRALTAMPAPENNDGLQWRLGNLIAMTASGMNWMDIDGVMCASSKHVVAHQESKSACFSTGKRDGYIFWERHVISHEVDFSLRFQYAESLKSAMDPIVRHVNASWQQ
jgi:hypothetical protein